MKKFKKVMVLLLAGLTVAVACAFTGCAGESKITGVYLSPSKMSYNNMRPAYNYYLTTFTQQEITLFDDGTYCFIEASSCFSALIIAETGNDFSANERTNYIKKFYGDYTSKANDLDDDLLDVTLSVPKRAVVAHDSEYYLDTESWTEAMGNKVKPSKTDPTTGQKIFDENAPAWTAKEYLDSVAFKETMVSVNTKTYSFDFTVFELQNPAG